MAENENRLTRLGVSLLLAKAGKKYIRKPVAETMVLIDEPFILVGEKAESSHPEGGWVTMDEQSAFIDVIPKEAHATDFKPYRERKKKAKA